MFQEKEKANLVSCLIRHLEQIKGHGSPVKTVFHSYPSQNTHNKERSKKMKIIADKIGFVDTIFLADPNECEHSCENILKQFNSADISSYFQALASGGSPRPSDFACEEKTCGTNDVQNFGSNCVIMDETFLVKFEMRFLPKKAMIEMAKQQSLEFLGMNEKIVDKMVDTLNFGNQSTFLLVSVF